jgi:hypothetical protein
LLYDEVEAAVRQADVVDELDDLRAGMISRSASST